MFHNCFLLKLLFFDPLTPLPPSPFIANDHMTPLGYVTPDTDTPLLSFFSLYLKFKKPQRYASTHDTSTHVFKQLN